MNIADRTSGSAAFCDSEAKLQCIAGAALNAIVMMDAAGGVVFWNPAAEKMFGWSAEEIIGRSVHDTLVPAWNRQHAGRGLSEFARTGEGPNVGHVRELLAVRKDGREFPVEIALSSVQSQGQWWAVAIIHDVTERKEAENALLESEKKYRLYFENTSDLILSITRDSQVCAVSPAARKVLGYGMAEDLSGKHYLDVLRVLPAYREVAAFRLARILSRERGEPTCYEFFAGNGEVRCAEVNGTAIVRNGEVVEVICVGRDVTDRKRAEESRKRQEAAEAANAAKNAFLARMSHEIRTPLNGVMGMLDLLGGSDLNERQRHYCHIAAMSANALLGLVSDILDFSKIQAGMLDPEQVEFDLHALLWEVAGLFADRARDKGLELLCKIDPTVPQRATGAPAQIRQLIANLVDNALKFTSHGGVEIHARLEPKQEGSASVRFDVRDTGIGIPGDRRDHLFDPFSQVDTSTTRKYAGTGLGLSICKQLAELMGGRIEVDSTLGQGSLFSAIIPLAAAHAIAGVVNAAVTAAGTEGRSALETKPERLEETARDFPSRRILIAEDNEINQLVVGEILRNEHFQCTIVSNGRIALETILARPYDAVLMDCEMPEMDGFAATREIRKLEDSGQLATRGGRRLPIIALTAHGDKGYRQKCRSAGMDDYASKPIDSEGLLTTVQRWLLGTDRSNAIRDEVAERVDGAGRPSVRQAAESISSTAALGPSEGNRPVTAGSALAECNQPPLDIKTFRDRCLGNDGLMRRVLRLFTQRASADLLRIHDALRSNDATATGKLTHALKGALANVSANAAAQYASALETLINDGRLAQAHEQFLSLEHELTRCVAFVEPMLQGVPAGIAPQL